MFGRKSFVVSESLFKSTKGPRRSSSSFYHQHLQTPSCQTSTLHSHSILQTSIKPNTRSLHTNPQLQAQAPKDSKMGITGPLVDMLARNRYDILLRSTVKMCRLLTTNSKIAETYQAPPPLMKMVEQMRATKQGVVVLSCSDPRLNPYQVLGIDATLSK